MQRYVLIFTLQTAVKTLSEWAQIVFYWNTESFQNNIKLYSCSFWQVEWDFDRDKSFKEKLASATSEFCSKNRTTCSLKEKRRKRWSQQKLIRFCFWCAIFVDKSILIQNQLFHANFTTYCVSLKLPKIITNNFCRSMISIAHYIDALLLN